MTKRTCAVEVCNRPANNRRWCQGHAKRYSDGRPMDTPIRLSAKNGLSDEERLYLHLDQSGGPAACWIWQGHTRKRKYGAESQLAYGRMSYTRDGRKTEYVHIVSFEVHRGRRVASGLEIRHLCNNPPCANPMHLTEGTRQENIQDSIGAGTHYSYFREVCAKGLAPWPNQI